MDRETYLRDLDPFFSSGLAWEIFSHENGSIINMANGFYVASTYSKDRDGNAIGIIVPQSVAKAAIKNWISFLKWFDALNFEEKCQCFMLFNYKTLEVAKHIKADTDMKGPSTDVDLEWEQSLQGKRKKF